MTNHGCSKCKGYEHCTHIRQDILTVEEFEEYFYAVTYIGGYAVVTGRCDDSPFYETLVVCVGFRSLGSIEDEGVENYQSRILYRAASLEWDAVEDHHEFICITLGAGVLQLSE